MRTHYKKVVVLDSVIFYPEHRERLNQIADQVIEYNTTADDEVAERCKGADCIISCWVNIPNRVIDENPQLKTIAFWTHDFEHRIDWRYARRRGIHIPAIPDYGTDSVAELVFIALLQLFRSTRDDELDPSLLGEEIVAALSDDVRMFRKNMKDTLGGRWIHEYVKTGKLQMKSAEEIREETLKGLTIGILSRRALDTDLLQIAARGLCMHAVYSLADYPHLLNVAYRPIEKLVAESQVVVYDSTELSEPGRAALAAHTNLSRVDVATLVPRRRALRGRTLGILGLGRIGGRVAQIARDGFGMNVLYYSRTRKPDLEERLGLTWAGLDEVVTGSEILSLHLPHHGADDYVSEEIIRRIPRGTTVINASVGNVISAEEVLLERFEDGDLRGFMDVYRGLPPRAELRRLQANLLATYRLGWRTKATVGLKTHKLLTKIAQLPDVVSSTSRREVHHVAPAAPQALVP